MSASPSIQVEIVFDGGSLGNPGQGYGSYQLTVDGQRRPIARLRFGSHVTSNQAEYRALVGALEGAARAVRERGGEPGHVALCVRGDSRLVLEQLAGKWRVRSPNVRSFHDRAAQLLRDFGSVELKWQPRTESVRILGH